MTAFISIFLYLIILFGVSILLFLGLTSVFPTDEVAIAFLLSLIATQMVLNTLGNIGKEESK